MANKKLEMELALFPQGAGGRRMELSEAYEPPIVGLVCPARSCDTKASFHYGSLNLAFPFPVSDRTIPILVILSQGTHRTQIGILGRQCTAFT